jgi:hypothetical protein
MKTKIKHIACVLFCLGLFCCGEPKTGARPVNERQIQSWEILPGSADTVNCLDIKGRRQGQWVFITPGSYQKTGEMFYLDGKPVYKKTGRINWLLGSWENKSKKGFMNESWEKSSDSTFAGRTFFVEGKDTVMSEKISIAETVKGFFYSPAVSNQNAGKEVNFKMTTLNDSVMVFENAGHDFPQFIVYKKINNDSLLAEISGAQNGRVHTESFPMRRVR